MNDQIELVHVIFKTHLDVGFTDYAHRVIARYFNEFIPSAIQLARQMHIESPEHPFCWTIGSWLLTEYLNQASAARRSEAEDAIAAGHLVWHALPFTTHTELMDADLFRAGLRLSQNLDQRFDRKTIAGKMTDVPGHTRGMLPLLAEAGVKLLHIGVNPAATVPDVPTIFNWHDPASGSRILMIYQNVYGSSLVLPGTNQAISLVFTGDNLGPPSQSSVHETYARLREEFPCARFVGSNLNAVTETLLAVQDDLPIVTAEIGDTWIQGTGSDPLKVGRYRELLRARRSWRETNPIDPDALTAFESKLLLIPEHTWGMDLKTHLQDYEHYETEALARVRQSPRFQHFEASWQEQRDYVDAAIDALPDQHRTEAKQALAIIQAQYPDLNDYQPAPTAQCESERWLLRVDPNNGSVVALQDKHSGAIWADETHSLALLNYETFSTGDYDRYWQQYIRDREHGEVRTWAHPDNVKPGLKVASHQNWVPQVHTLHRGINGSSLLIEAGFESEALRIGAPRKVTIEYTLQADYLEICLQWFDKPACRLPEAFWLSFRPRLSDPSEWLMDKMGQWISPLDVVSGGGRTLHAVDSGVRWQHEGHSLHIASLDAPLVAPGQPSLLDFHNRLPDLSGGMHFNLFNNVWGTNFTMWYDDDTLFRFRLYPQSKQVS